MNLRDESQSVLILVSQSVDVKVDFEPQEKVRVKRISSVKEHQQGQ